MTPSMISFGVPKAIQRARSLMDRHGALAFRDAVRSPAEMRTLAATLLSAPPFAEYRSSVAASTTPNGEVTQIVEGLACRYGQVAHIKNYGRVLFEDGCFDRSLSEGDAIKMLVDHDDDQELLSTADSALQIEAVRGLGLALRLPVEDRHRKIVALIEGGRDCLSVSGHIRASRLVYRADSDGTDGIRHISDFELNEISFCKEGAVLDAWVGVTEATGEKLADTAWSDAFHKKIVAGHEKTRARRVKRFDDQHGFTLDQSARWQRERTEALQGRTPPERRV